MIASYLTDLDLSGLALVVGYVSDMITVWEVIAQSSGSSEISSPLSVRRVRHAVPAAVGQLVPGGDDACSPAR